MEKTAFVNWEAVFSTNGRGRREARYYLKRRDGTSELAVVGKEKKLGHSTMMSSSTCSYRYAIREKSLLPVLSDLSFEIPSKLKSKRDVIDWLNSIVAVSDGSLCQTPQPLDGFLEAGDKLVLKLEKLEDTRLHKMGRYTTEFLWMGSPWTCRKMRKHYEAYSHNGVKISVHDFVYVLAEEDKQLVAHLDDMYEDFRGNKMVVVRWFHKVDEVGLDLPRSYNDREIFFSLCLQDLSIKCVDGLATVLSPQHYKSFVKAKTCTKLEPFVCQSRFDNDDVMPFDITQVKGYWKQDVHKYLFSTTSMGCPKLPKFNDDTKGGTVRHDDVGIRPRKRLRRLRDEDIHATPLNKTDAEDSSHLAFFNRKFNSENGILAGGCANEHDFVRKHQYTYGSKIEVLSQDSGIRGCWFRAVIIKKHKDMLKVKYHDIKDADDESINLEEWVSSSRMATPDQLGIRLCGRTTVRPIPPAKNLNFSLIDSGSVVDAWLHDGWWEGIVVKKESQDKVHVYFPRERKQSVLGCKDLRYSEEWLGDRWRHIEGRPDILRSISPAAETNLKLVESHDSMPNLEGTIHGKELSLEQEDNSIEKGVVGRDFEVVCSPSKADLLSRLNWNWSTKKRHGSNLSQRLDHYASKTNDLEVQGTQKHDCVLMPSSLKVDHDNCKFDRDSSLFHPAVVSSLTTLVMSR